MPPTTMEPVDTARLRSECQRTRAGRRLARLVHTHESEVVTLMLVHGDVNAHVQAALTALNALADSGVVDHDMVRVAEVVLDDFARLGSNELRTTVACLREELASAQGHSLDEVLAG